MSSVFATFASRSFAEPIPWMRSPSPTASHSRTPRPRYPPPQDPSSLSLPQQSLLYRCLVEIYLAYPYHWISSLWTQAAESGWTMRDRHQSNTDTLLQQFVTASIHHFVHHLDTELTYTTFAITAIDDLPLSADLSLIPLSPTLLTIHRAIIQDFPSTRTRQVSTNFFNRLNIAASSTSIVRHFATTYPHLIVFCHPPSDHRYYLNQSTLRDFSYPITAQVFNPTPSPSPSRSSIRRRSRSRSRSPLSRSYLDGI